MAALDIKTILAAAKEARTKQAPYLDTWQEIADYMMPARATFTSTPSPGSDRRRKMFDSTAEEALELLAAGLHGMLTSRSQRWFYLQADDPKLRNNYNVKAWLEAVMQWMYGVFNAPHSQFHSQIDQIYMDAGGFGTAILYSQETKDGLTFMARYLGECTIQENALGIVDTVYRRWCWPLAKIVEQWGKEVLPDNLRRAWDQGKASAVPDLWITHATLPRHDVNYDRVDAKGKPFASMYILEDTMASLEESGYNEFPYHIWRWRVRTGEIYGTGPGMRLLPDVKMLNEMFKTIIKAAQKAVDPPLWIPEAYRGLIRTYPGGLNFFDSNVSGKPEALEGKARMDVGLELLNAQREMIKRGFYRDAFDVTSDSDGVNVKATFTLARRDDKFRQLSPVFSRADAEFLEPTIIRVYNVGLRQGRYPPPPAELQGKAITVDYVSPVARAMRTPEADDIGRLLELMAAIGAVNPEVYDNVDFDATVQLAGSQLYNVPSGVLRSPDGVAQARAARQQQQAQQQALAAIPPGAEALKNVATAHKAFADSSVTGA